MSKEFQQIEQLIDEKFRALDIWNCSAQSIISTILYVAEQIDYKGDVDTAMDFVSRSSYLMNTIKEQAQSKEGTLSSDSVLETMEFVEDIQFLNAYSHYCMLMPQYYKKTFSVVKVDEKKYRLDFSSKEVEEAEVIDRLYSGLAQQLVITYPKEDEFRKYLDVTIAEGRGDQMLNNDFLWIADMYQHFLTYSISIEIVPSEVLHDTCGFSFLEYRQFTAAVRAFAEYYKELGRSNKRFVQDGMTEEERSFYLNKYINWTIPSLKHFTIGMIQGISELSSDSFMAILSYYTFIFEDNTNENYKENSVAGEAYTPPFMLVDKLFIQSPHCMKYMLPLNNVIYSLNKRKPDVFNNEFSQHLEPTLVNQLLYVFSKLKNVRCEPNVNYDKSEIDLLVLSEAEKVCLNIQVKTTIAPDSARTVRNVETRSIEGVDQLSLFISQPIEERMNIINSTFNTELDEIKIISILVVRSSAGSGKAWKHNDSFKIINYPLLASLVSRKVLGEEMEIANIDQEILEVQEEILLDSKYEIKHETLQIADYEISFPNIYFNSNDILGINLKTFAQLPNFEKSNPSIN